ncbi:hypothetical protein PFDG_05042 [Plasmodium falciparum Dd2]|uniref:Uncharacterized protein n=1 Tax=Plasmodium falciparum (isolate Dd2) TaxID=57267 RepID=A0A0L7M9L7_PLAF4|nr:hypothetical protein PFDG_05042 [Plasmodium falciparum Dd2]
MSPFYDNRNIMSENEENNVKHLNPLNPFDIENNISKEIHNNMVIDENEEKKDKDDKQYYDNENRNNEKGKNDDNQ